ncbi:MAG: response regulator [Thermodesulfobacteriota bacterium]|nr:response regulator [Thermodesulfobacteriota bacterium]
MDGLNETDDLLLLPVVTSLDNMVNPGIIETVKKTVQKDDEQAKHLIKAIVSAKALSLFTHLYETPEIGGRLIAAVLATNNEDTIATFAGHLKTIDTERAGADAEKLATASTVTRGKRILVVDDSKAMLAFYRDAIAGMGLNILEAEHGKAALDIVKGNDPVDLIVTDMNMPVMDGIEFTRKLRENPSFAATPVIMATTESDQSQVAIATDAGVTAFINKPFPAETLQAKIDTYLND